MSFPSFAGHHRQGKLSRGVHILLAASLLATPVVVAHAEGHALQPRPQGIVYVEDNITTADGGNGVLAYRQDAHGSLSALPRSPFATRGGGVTGANPPLGVFDSDQDLIVNSEHTLLFAANSGSNSISVFHIKGDGSLALVSGSPFPSGGINPVSLGLERDILTVVNKNQDPNQDPALHLPNYTTFYVESSGQLKPIANSAVYAAPGSSPAQAFVEHRDRVVFGTDFLGGLLESFVILPDGRLGQNEPQALPASEFAGTGKPAYPLGLWNSPVAPVLYVGFVTISRLGVYAYDPDGSLYFLKTVADTGAGLCWIRSNTAGTRIYTSNTTSNSISVYDTTDPYSPVQIQELALKGVGNVFAIELDPSGKYLYAVDELSSATATAGNALHTLKINADGTLTEAASSPVVLPIPANNRPKGIATL